MENNSEQKEITFSESLRLERQRNRMTQTDLANIMSVTRQTVSSWEKGTRLPDVPTMETLAEVLHTSVYRLLGGKENAENENNNKPMELQEIARQLALLNSHYAEMIWQRKRKWKLLLSILGLLTAIAIIVFIMRFYTYHYRSAASIETKPLQEETSILN